VIGFDLPDTVNAEVDGVPIFECNYGTLNSQYALKIERVLAIPQHENSPGDDHAV
jgi:flagellar motor switch protein FliM